MFDAYRKWLGIPPNEQPPNHYRLLGLGLFEHDLDVIKSAVVQRSAYVRNFQLGKQAEDATRILNEIAAAEACLTNPTRRTAYDADLKRKQTPPPATAPPAVVAHAPRIDPLLEQAAAMTSFSAPWASPQFTAGRPRSPKYVPLAIGGGVLVVVVVALGILLSSMLAGDDDAPADHGDAIAAISSAPGAESASIPAVVTTPKADEAPAAGSAGAAPAAAPAPDGLAHAIVDQPIAVAATASPAPPLPDTDKESTAVDSGEGIDLLKRIDPARDSIVGRWFFEQGKLISPGHHAEKLQIPYDLPDAYKLTIVAQRVRGEDGLPLGIVIGGRQCLLAIDSFGTTSGLSYLDGKGEPDNETRHDGPVIKTNQPFTLVCVVRPTALTATLDDKVIVDWSGSPERFSLGGLFWVPGRKWLFLSNGFNAEFHFTRIHMEPLEDVDPGFDALTAELADLKSWSQRGGDWAAVDGGIIGRGNGSLDFARRFPQDFQFEMTMTVRDGTRARLHLGETDLYIGSEGAGRNLWLCGQAQTNLQGRPFDYQFNSPLKVVVRACGPMLGFSVNGRPVASARRSKICPVQCVLQPGDAISSGDVEFRDFRVTAPVLSPDEAMSALRDAGATVEEVRRGGASGQKITMQGLAATDYVLGYVRWLPDTRELFLDRSAVTDGGLAHLTGLERLEVLGLSDVNVGDAGLAHLAGLPRLTSLNLTNTYLTDAGLAHLAGAPKLETVILTGDKVSDAAVNELKRQLPRLTIRQ